MGRHRVLTRQLQVRPSVREPHHHSHGGTRPMRYRDQPTVEAV
jgi:hypothetical protein